MRVLVITALLRHCVIAHFSVSRYCTTNFSLSCRIVSVTSYLRENEAENLQNGDIHLAQVPDFGMGYLEIYQGRNEE